MFSLVAGFLFLVFLILGILMFLAGAIGLVLYAVRKATGREVTFALLLMGILLTLGGLVLGLTPLVIVEIGGGAFFF